MNKSLLDYFDKIAPGRSKQRRAKRYYWNDITRQIKFFVTPDTAVLEIGCGTGELLNDLPAKIKTGIDFSPAMIAEAKKNFPDLDVHVMDAAELHLTKKYDLIILSNLVGYAEDVQLVFEQLHRVCHEHTKIIVTYYNFLWEPILKFGEFIGYKTKTPHQNWLSLAELNNLLYLSGFYVYRNSRSMLLPVYIPLISEILNKVIAKLPLFRLLDINTYTFAKPMYRTQDEELKSKYSVSVIIPVRNESGNIEDAVKRLPDMGNHTEIIFVESHSTDDSWSKIEEVKKKYGTSRAIKSYQVQEEGKGAAVRFGFENATGEVLMILDADLTVSPEELPKFYDAIASGHCDFVNGSRLVYQMEKEAMRYLNILANKCFSSIFTWLLEQRFKDTLCGTKVMLRKDYLRLSQNRSYFGAFDPFGDFDLIFGAYKLNLCIAELPIHYKERTYGRSNISRFKHGWLLLKMCFFAARKIKFR